MRLLLALTLLASSSCISIHTVDFAMHRPSKAPTCDVPMSRSGTVPEGWTEIGYVVIEFAAEWTEQQLATEVREQACEMGAEYVVVAGQGDFVRATFLVRGEPQAQQ